MIFLRHAPVAEGGRLFGRTDVDARIEESAMAALRRTLPTAPHLFTSGARRCNQTARALWPELEPQKDARLWEQDFGCAEGVAHDDLPDLGPLSRAELATHRHQNGESFEHLCDRVWDALLDIAVSSRPNTSLVLVVHAGTIRAALALVLECRTAALAFEVPPLSVLRLGMGPAGPVSIRSLGSR